MTGQFYALTYLGDCGAFVDPVTAKEWAVGDTHLVDEETAQRLVPEAFDELVEVGKFPARWQVAPIEEERRASRKEDRLVTPMVAEEE